MDLKEIRTKDSRELVVDVQVLRKEAFEISFRAAPDEANPARRKQIRREIARIKTVLRQREIVSEVKNA